METQSVPTQSVPTRPGTVDPDLEGVSDVAMVGADTGSSDEGLPPEVDGAQIDALDAVLDGVERSLGRIDAGRYGQCDECGSLIDDALLLADPTASRCAACPPPAPD